MLIDKKETHAAAIAGREAARHYHGKVLAEGLEDDPANYTRFFLLGRDDVDLDGVREVFAKDVTGPRKTSLVFYIEHAPGSLQRALRAFAERGIDLTRIESRPIRGKPFEYLFYLDFVGDPATPPGSEAIEELSEQTGFLRVLGAYPSGRLDWVGSDVPLQSRSDLSARYTGAERRKLIDRRKGPRDRRRRGERPSPPPELSGA
jgi:prephenate dehydratase